MIEFGGKNIGWPWHGLYNAATRKISTINGVTVDAPGEVPTGGNAYGIAIPGLPTPVITPADAAAGRNWQSWAVISGLARCLYGKALGDDQHVYIDSSGRPWLVRVVRSGSRVSQTITAQVSIKRFGVVGSAIDDWQTLSPVSVGFSLHSGYQTPLGWTETSGVSTLDIRLNGGRMLVGVWRAQTNGVETYGRGFAAVAEIVFSGSPDDGNFSAAMAPVTDESQVDQYPPMSNPADETRHYLCVYVEPAYTDPPPGAPQDAPLGGYDIGGVYWINDGQWYRDYAFSWQMLSSDPGAQTIPGYPYVWPVTSQSDWSQNSAELSGARYGASGAVEVVSVETHWELHQVNAASMSPGSGTIPILDYPVYQWTCSESGYAVETMTSTMVVGGAVARNTTTRTTSRTASGQVPPMRPDALARSFDSVTTTSDGQSSSYSYSIGINAPGDYITFPWAPRIGVAGTNSVKVLSQAKYDHALGYSSPWMSSMQRGPVLGRLTRLDNFYTDLHVSEHPVTGELSVSTAHSICWV